MFMYNLKICVGVFGNIIFLIIIINYYEKIKYVIMLVFNCLFVYNKVFFFLVFIIFLKE